MSKILLVEDDDTISFGIRVSLEKKGYEISACSSLADAKELFSAAFALVLLDLNLPDGTGYEFCTWVKARCDTPIIFLTVRDEVRDITKGLDIAILESRIAAVLRRAQGETETSFVCGNISLNQEKMQVLLDGQVITLTALEYRMLLILMENKGRTLPRSLILEKLWDSEGNFVNDNTLTVTVKRLREKLNNTRCIATIRGIGYRMEEAGDGA